MRPDACWADDLGRPNSPASLRRVAPRQSNRERRTGAAVTLDGKLTTHLRDQRMRDRQSQTDTGQRCGTCAAVVRLKDRVAFRSSDPGAGVGDANLAPR